MPTRRSRATGPKEDQDRRRAEPHHQDYEPDRPKERAARDDRDRGPSDRDRGLRRDETRSRPGEAGRRH